MREARDEPGCVRKDTTPRRRPPIAEVVRGGVRTVESSHTRPGRQPGMSGKIVTCNDGTCPGHPRSGHDSWPREGLRSVGSDLRRHFGPCPRAHSPDIAPPPGRGRPGRLGCGLANGYGERSWMYQAGHVRRPTRGRPEDPRPPIGGSRTSEGHRRTRAPGRWPARRLERETARTVRAAGRPEDGAGNGIRTRDPRLGRPML